MTGDVLLLYYQPVSRRFREASTVMEHVRAFPAHSRFRVWALNTDLGFPPALAGQDFGAIVLHYSLFGAGHRLFNERFMDYIDHSDAYKVAFFQDEHYFCGRRFAFLNEHPVDCVYTHVEPEHFHEVYGAYTSVGKLVFNLPGYVGGDLLEAAERFALPEERRTVDVGYRGRELAPVMGRAGLEKTEIGRRFAELAAQSGLVLDIDTTESGRLYGEDWHRFIARCRTMLGVESGASVFDLEDEVLSEYNELLSRNGSATLEQLERGSLARWDNRVPYRTIGPRHFEAAAFGVCQVLFEGRYNGVIEPMVHYIPLKKDFSNFDEVVERIRDADLRRELAANAHRDLVVSGRWSYERFIGDFDETLLAAGLEPELGSEAAPERARALAAGSRGRRLRAEARHAAMDRLVPLLHRAQPVTRRVRRLIGRPLTYG